MTGVGTTTAYEYDLVSRLIGLGHDLAGTGGDLTIGAIGYNPASQIVGQTRSNDTYAWTGHGSGTTGYTRRNAGSGLVGRARDGINDAAGPGIFRDANGLSRTVAKQLNPSC